MQATFKPGQRVLVAAVTDEGKQTGEPLYRSAAIVQAKEDNPDQYLIATLNHDDEVNMFVGYFPANRLRPNVKDNSLVESVVAEYEETTEDDWSTEFDVDGTEQIYAVIRDDLDADYFDPEHFDGNIQLVKINVDGELFAVCPSESLSKAFDYVNTASAHSENDSNLLKRLAALWAKPSASAFDVTEREIATFIPDGKIAPLALERDEIVSLGFMLLGHDGVALVREQNQFAENVNNEVRPGIIAVPSTIFEPVSVILNELKNTIVNLSEENRLTSGSDVVLEFEPVVEPISVWEEFGFDPTVEMEDDEDEDDEDDDSDDEDEDEDGEVEGEHAPESEQPQPGSMTSEIANNLQTAFSAFSDSLPESLGAPIEIVSTNTVFSADLALVTIAVATKEDAPEVGPMVESLEAAISSMLVGDPDYTAALMECDSESLIAFANYFGLNADDSMDKEAIVERINDNVDASEIEEFLEG